jgi:hypothetical protein
MLKLAGLRRYISCPSWLNSSSVMMAMVAGSPTTWPAAAAAAGVAEQDCSVDLKAEASCDAFDGSVLLFELWEPYCRSAEQLCYQLLLSDS